jgi:hypothetical protein
MTKMTDSYDTTTFRNQLDALSISSSPISGAAMPRPVQRHIQVMHFSCFRAQHLSGAGSRSLPASKPPLTPAGVERLTTTLAESDGNIGYAVQTVRGKADDGIVMLGLRCEDGIWLVCCEAVIA